MNGVIELSEVRQLHRKEGKRHLMPFGESREQREAEGRPMGSERGMKTHQMSLPLPQQRAYATRVLHVNWGSE